MKKLLAFLFIGLTLQACAKEPVGNSMISGRVTVINAYGNDITKYCRKTVKRGGVFSQSAAPGVNKLEQITCVNGYEIYRIKGDRFSVNVPGENMNIDFGSVKITLNPDASFKVSGGNGKLKIGDTTRGWSLHNINNIGR